MGAQQSKHQRLIGYQAHCKKCPWASLVYAQKGFANTDGSDHWQSTHHQTSTSHLGSYSQIRPVLRGWTTQHR